MTLLRHPVRWSVLGLAVLLAAPPAGAQPPSELQSFYTVRQLWTGHDIVSVEAVGQDVRVRAIRVASADEECPHLVVRAIERTFPQTTVQAMAGVRVCALSNRRITRALARAPREYQSVDFIGGADFVVATCGAKEKFFAFIEPTSVSWTALRRRAPDVADAWNLGGRLKALVTTLSGGSLDEGTEAVRAEQEALGLALLPELVSGKYNAALPDRCWDATARKDTACVPNYLGWQLRGYTGPPAHRGPLPLELLERESLGLITYVPPVMPQIAISARVFGDVRLRLAVDRQTGLVTNAEAVSGSSLHVPSALTAARAWRFDPKAAPADPVEVTLRFEVRCAAP